MLQQLSQAGEHPADDSPQNLARSATRMEMQQPGSMTRMFGGGMGMGGVGMGIGTSLLTSIAGTVIGTSIAHAMFDGFDGDGFGDFDGDQGGMDQGGMDGLGDFGGGDFGGGDLGGF